MTDPNAPVEIAPPRTKFTGSHLLQLLQAGFQWLLDLIRAIPDLIRILKPARFSFFILVVSSVALLTGPGQDLLRSAGERPLNDGLHWLFFGTGVCFWAGCIWYWARVILRFKHEIDEETGNGGKKTRFYKLRLKTPRWLGTIALVMFSIASISAARSYQSTEWFHLSDPAFRLWLVGFGALLLTVSFGFFVAERQKLLTYLAEAPFLPESIQSFFNPLPEQIHYSAEANLFQELPTATKKVAKFSLAICLILLFLFSINSVAVTAAPAFGALTILFFALGVWVFLGTILVFLTRRFRIPFITIGMALVLVFSLFNDNHQIRTLDQSIVDVAGVPDIREHVRRWDDFHASANTRLHDQSSPIFLIAAEGGGVRAAYWTSLVLSILQDTIYQQSENNVRFSDHIYAISGASGGSIGAGVFTALVAEELDRNESYRMSGNSYVKYTQQILDRDFLSPVFSKFVVSDAVQRLIPVPLPALDRGAALEVTFENAWASQFDNNNRFADSFASLWSDHQYRVPSLIVNATHVESGRRMLTTNLPIKNTFADALDLRFEMENEMRLSTALHNGARFPYVNPAGTIRNHNQWLGRIRGRVVDGGYFDNSGAASLKEVYDKLVLENLKYRVHVIWISNSPLETAPDDTSLVEPTFFKRGIYEFLSPPTTILNTRDARARQAVDNLASAVGEDRVFKFSLCKRMPGSNSRKAALPLSWDLSEQAMNDMTRQLSEGCEYSDNNQVLDEVVQLILSSSPGG